MAKQADNNLAIDLFKENRCCYNDNGILWTTFCKVTCIYQGRRLEETMEVWIRQSKGEHTHVELRGFKMNDDTGSNTIFSARQASISYQNETLIIQGTRDKAYYRILIGEYDGKFVY